MKFDFEDITITCPCGKEFTWTAGEQQFMQDLFEKGKIQEVRQPKRCAACREERKKQREERGE